MKRCVKRASVALGIAVAALLAAPALATSSLTIDWRHTKPLSGTVANDGWLQIDTTTGGTFPLAVIDRPPVNATDFAIDGEISFHDVEGSGYLEMWIAYPGGARYFSRTLASTGPQEALTGSSIARPFTLPFTSTGPAPTRLEVNLVLPATGSVRIGPLRLVGSTQVPGMGWWSDRTAGLAGGVAGSGIGLLGGLLGFLVARGKARRFVLGAMATLAVIGGVALAAAVVALIGSQPFAVSYPLALGGVLLIGIFVPGSRAARRSYANAELRRIRALDLTAMR